MPLAGWYSGISENETLPAISGICLPWTFPTTYGFSPDSR